MVLRFDNDLKLAHAASKNDAQAALAAIKRGADVNSDNGGITPLLMAINNGSVEVAEILLKNGAKLNVIDGEGWTPLTYAATQEYGERIAELLLKHGADINMKDGSRYRPIDVAATMGNVRIVEVLIKNGADLGENDALGITPLILAASKGNLPVAARLVESGADVNYTCDQGTRALDIAIIGNKPEIRDLLLRNGAVPTEVDDYIDIMRKVEDMFPGQ
jgi:ankyrin repeat protein